MNLDGHIPRAWADGFFAVGDFMSDPTPSIDLTGLRLDDDGRWMPRPRLVGRWCPHGPEFPVDPTLDPEHLLEARDYRSWRDPAR